MKNKNIIKNAKNAKKYDDEYIDNLLKKAMKSEETPCIELTQTTPSGDASPATPPRRGITRGKLNMSAVKRFTSTAAAVVITFAVISGLVFTAVYLNKVTPPLDDNAGIAAAESMATEITDTPTQNATQEEYIDVAEIIERNLEVIMSSPSFSSITADYIVKHLAEYNEIVAFGDDAFEYMLSLFERGENGLKDSIMAYACCDILGDETDFGTGQEWYKKYMLSVTGVTNFIGVDFAYSLEGNENKDVTYSELQCIDFWFEGAPREFDIADFTDLKLFINGTETKFALEDIAYRQDYVKGNNDMYRIFLKDGNGKQEKYGKGIIIDIPSAIRLTGNYMGVPFDSEEKTSPVEMPAHIVTVQTTDGELVLERGSVEWYDFVFNMIDWDKAVPIEESFRELTVDENGRLNYSWRIYDENGEIIEGGDSSSDFYNLFGDGKTAQSKIGGFFTKEGDNDNLCISVNYFSIDENGKITAIVLTMTAPFVIK